MKLIIMLVLGLVLLGGAGGGGYYFYTTYYAPKPEGEEKVKEPPKPPEEPIIFVKVQPLVVSLIGTNRVTQIISVVVSVEMPEAKKLDAERKRAFLYDALLSAVYAAIGDGQAMAGEILIPSVLKAKLVVAARRVLGEETVRDVLIQTVLQRKL
ncbi:flagellar FliL protein [uncultured Gammaproteobacteria bacterium]